MLLCGVFMAIGAEALLLLPAREDIDGREDEDGAEQVKEAESDVQDGDGEQDGGEGLR